MKNVRGKIVPPYTNKIFLIFILVATIFMGVGYASINSISLDINGEVIAKAQDGIFITEVNYVSDINANLEESKILNAYQTNLSSTVSLSPTESNSSITYEVSIYNSNDIAYVFDKVDYLIGNDTYNNEDISFILDGLEIGDVVNSEETITFKITFFYKDNIISDDNSLSSMLNFVFLIKTYNFVYTGNMEEFIVDYNGEYKIELWGASGGISELIDYGKGAYTVGDLELQKSDTVYINVGGQGTLSDSIETYISGGYNGGGDANYGAGTGGGATDIRINGNSLNDRIMVAAGGGGTGIFSNQETGGSGGTFVGFDGGSYSNETNVGVYGGTGGNQISGGLAGNYWTGEVRENAFLGTNGEFGIGGKGGYETNFGHGAGAGGGGYYGGGAGSERNGGGAGGSSYISGHLGCVAITSSTDITPLVNIADGTASLSYSYHYSGKKFTNTKMISGNDEMPSYDELSTMLGNIGNGYAKVTLLKEDR